MRGVKYSWKELISCRKDGGEDREVEGTQGASSKSKGGRNASRHKGIVRYPKSSQEGLTVRFVD